MIGKGMWVSFMLIEMENSVAEWKSSVEVVNQNNVNFEQIISFGLFKIRLWLKMIVSLFCSYSKRSTQAMKSNTS